MNNLRHLFLLDSGVHFLNHGSFGARPRPVFEAYQCWQRELERQPVAFLGRRWFSLMEGVRSQLAAYVNSPPEDLVLIPNATYGVNAIARSLPFAPGDEILTTTHEYGACDRIWRFVTGRHGAHYVRQPIPLPVDDPDDIITALWSAVTPRTRAIFISHITSPTALQMPVAQICARARSAGILTIVDGAHAPGQIPLDLPALGADFYTGNCHKWMMAPPGAAFLYARPERQALLEPLVVSWGWESEWETGWSPFVAQFSWLGTGDPAAYLAIPTAIAFQEEQDWESVRATCHDLAVQAQQRISALTGLPALYPPASFVQMFAVPVPTAEPRALQARLYDEFAVEVPLIAWDGQALLRVSLQGYNDETDVDALLQGLAALLAPV
ncbi:MAG: aminotransferase class V-fold PLP-dependent enzyme [Anaerolineae bacterium]|nr:aminotransferase class V-fold PLP-dependent enzyme [Anaerolineae bacterium]